MREVSMRNYKRKEKKIEEEEKVVNERYLNVCVVGNSVEEILKFLARFALQIIC